MSVLRPVRQHNQISKTMADVAMKALAQLSRLPAPQIAEVGGDIKSGRMTMEKAAKLYPEMHEVGFGLYRIATDDETLPTIWKREVFTDKDTGAKVEWLVAYTTDDDDIMREVASSIKKVAEAPPGASGGNEAPKKNQTPIAPGVLNKNLNLDQSGQGGTAKVTVEFNDIAKGQQFFESVEENAGGAAKAPGAAPEAEEKPPAVEEGEAPEGEGKPEPKGPPTPTPAGGPGAGAPPAPPMMASTIKNLTVYGQQMVTVKAIQYPNYPTQFYYVNEIGQKVNLPFKPVLGTKFNRPDQLGTMIRVMHIESEAGKSDDEDIIKALAVDISDQVPPMNWTNKQSQNENDEGGQGGKPLPPQPALQPGQPPTADTNQPKPLYDSTQDTGTKPKYNISVNPEDNSVTVKLQKPEAIDAIEQAVQGPQSPMQPPAQAPGAQPPAQAGAPMAGQPKQNFNEAESPVQF